MPPAARAQGTGPARPTSLAVFLDCNFHCDEDYIRTEIDYVNWVRDRAVADVHVLGTAQQTGSGGREYTLAFIGLKAFENVADTLRYVGGNTETDDERRKGLVRTLQTGLVRFLARTTIADRLKISVTAGASGAASGAQTQHDPWNNWVFRTSFNANTSGDANNTFRFLNGSFRAQRVTQDWKVEVVARENYSQSDFTIDGETSTFIRRNYALEHLTVRSLGARMAVGLRSNIGQSTFDNKKFSLRVQPAFEYDLFPYSEATRRAFTLQYAIGWEAFRYQDTTVYRKIREGHPLHSLAANLIQNQPWGSVDLRLEGGQYLDMTNKNYAEVGGDLSVRLFKGFNVNFGGQYEAIRNQIYLPAAGATPEEILTQQRQLATNYQYFMFMGLSYTFGSVFNNVVNPRFARN